MLERRADDGDPRTPPSPTETIENDSRSPEATRAFGFEKSQVNAGTADQTTARANDDSSNSYVVEDRNRRPLLQPAGVRET